MKKTKINKNNTIKPDGYGWSIMKHAHKEFKNTTTKKHQLYTSQKSYQIRISLMGEGWVKYLMVTNVSSGDFKLKRDIALALESSSPN